MIVYKRNGLTLQIVAGEATKDRLKDKQTLKAIKKSSHKIYDLHSIAEQFRILLSKLIINVLIKGNRLVQLCFFSQH